MDYLVVVGLDAADEEGVGHLQALHEGHEGHVKLSTDSLCGAMSDGGLPGQGVEQPCIMDCTRRFLQAGNHDNNMYNTKVVSFTDVVITQLLSWVNDEHASQ